MTNSTLRFGDIFFVELPVIANSSVQSGIRPVIVISNDSCNKHSPTITVIPLTSRLTKNTLPTHVLISGCGLSRVSIALAEQILTIDKRAIKDKVGSITETLGLAEKIKKALMVQLNIDFGMAA